MKSEAVPQMCRYLQHTIALKSLQHLSNYKKIRHILFGVTIWKSEDTNTHTHTHMCIYIWGGGKEVKKFVYITYKTPVRNFYNIVKLKLQISTNSYITIANTTRRQCKMYER